MNVIITVIIGVLVSAVLILLWLLKETKEELKTMKDIYLDTKGNFREVLQEYNEYKERIERELLNRVSTYYEYLLRSETPPAGKS